MNIQRFLPIQLSFVLSILLLLQIKECGSKRGGILTGSRGTSASRSGGLFGGLRRSGGGSFGSVSGSRTRGGVPGSVKSGYPHGSRWGMHGGGSTGRIGAGRWSDRSRSTSWGRPRGSGL